MSLIVGVPGAGHYQSGTDIQQSNTARTERWKGYLAEGLGRSADEVDLTLAPYGQHLHQRDPVHHGAIADDLLDHLSDRTTEMVEQWLNALNLPLPTSHGRLTVPLHIAVAVAAQHFSLDGELTKMFAALFFQEADAYLRERDNPDRHAIREEIGDYLAAHKPKIVIAHSLGAIPAYEAICHRPELEVDCFITLGAPLAIPGAVFDRLDPAPVRGTAPRPPGVKHWINIADRGDPFTVLRPFKNYFPDVDADVLDSIAPFEFHRAKNYLRCSAVTATVSLLLGRA